MQLTINDPVYFLQAHLCLVFPPTQMTCQTALKLLQIVIELAYHSWSSIVDLVNHRLMFGHWLAKS